MQYTSKSNQEYYEIRGNSEMTKACERVVHQCAKISLPVEVSPFAMPGKITTRCYGKPEISLRECKNVCHFIITQKVCIEFPIKFGALTETKKVHFECEKPDVKEVK